MNKDSEHHQEQKGQGKEREEEGNELVFTTAPKRTFAYHDLDCVVYEKRNRATVNRSPLFGEAKRPDNRQKKDLVKPNHYKGIKEAPSKQGQNKPGKSISKLKSEKETKTVTKKPHKKIIKAKAKPNVINQEKQSKIKQTQQREKREKNRQKNRERNRARQQEENGIASEKEESNVDHINKGENHGAQEVFIKPDLVKVELLKRESVVMQNRGEEEKKDKQSLSEEEEEQNEKRVLRKRPEKQLQSVKYIENDSLSCSEYDQPNKRLRRNKNNPEGQYSLNRIFPTQVTFNRFSNISLNVKYQDFDFLKFSDTFGTFDLLMITEPIQHFFTLDDITRVSKVGFLFFWIQGHEMAVGYHLMDRWGYDIVDQIIWVKTKPNNTLDSKECSLFKNAIEICLVGYKSQTKDYVQYKSKVSNNLIFAEDSGQKPDEIYQICELMLPGGKRLDFANHPREGWFTLIDDSLREKTSPSPKYIFRKFMTKCFSCQEYITEVCFHCPQCTQRDLSLCKGCFFKNAQTEVSHPKTHKWQIQTTTTKTNSKPKNCFYCASVIDSQQRYICEECNNLYVCLQCHHKESTVEGRGRHCHNPSHNLSLEL